MNRNNRRLLNLVFGIATCLLLIGISAPTMSKTVPTKSDRSATATQATTFDAAIAEPLLAERLAQHLQAAEVTQIAQEMPSMPSMPSTSTRYVAVMKRSEVKPNTATTNAFGAAGATLTGNRLVVRGDFSNLTSPLRDYATDPVSPANPKITSGIHLHRGEPNQNGPFQYALEVELKNPQAGKFKGDFTLTDEQLQALSSGRLYLDLHTKQNRAGELRGILKPFSN
jgi:hypothetical protein